MHARVATFQGDPASVDDMVARIQSESAGGPPPGLEGAKFLMLVDRETGKSVGITLFDTEEALQRGHEALEGMSPGGTSQRSGVEFFDVPVSML